MVSRSLRGRLFLVGMKVFLHFLIHGGADVGSVLPCIKWKAVCFILSCLLSSFVGLCQLESQLGHNSQ